ncbi:Protein of unknown function [Pedobacter steynii]|uniref:DUF3667 domain-containing protein n=1 Tax=Pedobacter steynii TaxID=430522 RepID=A0A1G9KNX4_9SPHI|nr:DUF3667 domain-containing protein [Pedobacter steynii]NQX38606.1 DUF3667 domain-containing protein [Pedobacter steynii]SDL51359.1 Protein of unknown function [Pedobacter steynii]
MSGRYRKEKNCLNCGHTVEDHFCSHCGQENIIVEEDALHMIAHATADYFHFESKFFGTLKPLLVKPGWLTQQYVAGKRVAFIHPIRLYIFVSIVFFLVILSGGHKVNNHIKFGSKKKTETQKQDSIKKDGLTIFKEGISRVPVSGRLKDSIISDIDKNAKERRAGQESEVAFFEMDSLLRGGFATVEDYDKHQRSLPKPKRDGFIENYITKKNIELRDYPGGAGKKMFEDFLHNLPKMMFLLLPLFAFLLKLVYIRKKKYYYEHLIFSFHLHSAIFLSILITIFLGWLSGFVYNVTDFLQGVCFFYIVWHIYRSLRTFYNSSRWITTFKIFFLLLGYTILVSITFLIGILVSVVLI